MKRVETALGDSCFPLHRGKTAVPMLCVLCLVLLFAVPSGAQEPVAPPPLDLEMQVGKVLLDGDSVLFMQTSPVYVYPQPTFRTRRQQQQYVRLVRNVKRVLPIAKEVRQMLIETAEYIETLPNKKERDEHLKRVEAAIVREYKPRMKKLTFAQGKLLIKLVDRELGSTAYDAMKAFIGPLRAGFWQAFAWTFGASLKKSYDPEGEDRLTEQIVLQVEAGQL